MKTQFKRLHLDRLQKLAEHLNSGKLFHKRWNIACYNENEIRPAGYKKEQFHLEKSTDAGYNNGFARMGNAIGECPGLFPNEWMFVRLESDSLGVSYVPVLKTFPATAKNSEMKSAMNFFQITEDEYHLLFTPFGQDAKKYAGWFQLRLNSDVFEQAYNIWRFISDKAESISVKMQIPQL